MRNTLQKHERLHSIKEIDCLFQDNVSIFVYPFKILYNFSPTSTNAEANVLFTMSHKKFKLAVQRNAIKRQLRECYRTQKCDLINQLNNKKLNAKIAFIYVADTLIPHQEINSKMAITIKRLCKLVEQEQEKKNKNVVI